MIGSFLALLSYCLHNNDSWNEKLKQGLLVPWVIWCFLVISLNGTLLGLHKTTTKGHIASIIILTLHLLFYLCCFLSGLSYFVSFKHSFEIRTRSSIKSNTFTYINDSGTKSYIDSDVFTVGRYTKRSENDMISVNNNFFLAKWQECDPIRWLEANV